MGFGDIRLRNRVRNAFPGWKPVFDQTFVKSLRVRNALRVGFGDIRLRNRVNNAFPGWKPVFDQTFGKSLVNSLRVRNALRVGAGDILFHVLSYLPHSYRIYSGCHCYL